MMTPSEYMENKGLSIGDYVHVIDPCPNEDCEPKLFFRKIIDVGRSFIYLEDVNGDEWCAYPKSDSLWLQYF